MRTTRQKKAIATIAVLLAIVIAAVVWLSVAAVKDTNPVCLFKHHYGDDGVCTRCGQEKPADKPEEEQPKPEPEQPAQPQASVFSATQLAASSESENVFKPLDSNYYVKGSNVLESDIIEVDWDIENFRQVGSSTIPNLTINFQSFTSTSITLPLNSNFSIGHSGFLEDYYIVFRKLGWTKWKAFREPNTEEGKKTIVREFSITEYGIYDFGLVTLGGECRMGLFARVNYGAVTELPAVPSKTGYTFTGWYTDEACTQLYTEDYVTSDITLYAGFTPITYTLNFMAQGGNGTMQQMQCTYDVEYTLPTCAFTYPNYRFVGWAIDDDSDEAEIGLTDGQKFSNLSEVDNCVIDLFAKWELDTVTVSFDVDGTVTPTTVTIGQAATLPDEPSKTGYIFLGWYTEDGELYNNEAITADCTLTARFEIIRCTVTFIVDGQVYAVYVCDYGTSIKDALQGAGVNTALYKADKQSGNF